MRHVLVLPLFSLFLSLGTANAASPGDKESALRVGVGGLLAAGADATSGSLTIPLRLGSVLRVEPEISGEYSRSADKETASWLYSFGVGVAASWGTGAIRPVIGVRVGATDAGTKSSTEKDSDGGLFVGAVLGAEHFATDSLSIGAEGRMTYTAAGGGGVVIAGTLAARIYFN